MEFRSPQYIKQLLGEKQEVAFIDVREAAEYGSGHPFFVSHIPYSVLEAKIWNFVPCRVTTVILIDGANGISEKAAHHLEAEGYENIVITEGGIKAWSDAGYALYEGISAPSKSFGEIVEHELGTVSISAPDLKARMDTGDNNFIILDGRTPAEYNKMTIPGSTSCPNAELVLRYKAMVPNSSTDIIINCAGRTRSLIGAQSLRMLGLPNKVYALENGTMGWKLAGLELEYGAKRSFPIELDEEIIIDTEIKANELIDEYSVDVIEHECFQEWRSDRSRTTYLFDVRTEEEYKKGYLKEAVHAPGGQLIQATDQWFATRNARIVVYDDLRIRAVMTVIWLKGMGHDAYVLNEQTTLPLILNRVTKKRCGNAEFIGPDEIDILNSTIIDVRSSQEYRDSHIVGAIWSIRPNLGEQKVKEEVVIIASDLGTADLAAKEFPDKNTYFSLSTPEQWQKEGIETASTPNDPPDEDRIDFLFHTHGRHSGNLDHAREYLRWEIGLLAQLDEQEKSVLRPLKA